MMWKGRWGRATGRSAWVGRKKCQKLAGCRCGLGTQVTSSPHSRCPLGPVLPRYLRQQGHLLGCLGSSNRDVQPLWEGRGLEEGREAAQPRACSSCLLHPCVFLSLSCVFLIGTEIFSGQVLNVFCPQLYPRFFLIDSKGPINMGWINESKRERNVLLNPLYGGPEWHLILGYRELGAGAFQQVTFFSYSPVRRDLDGLIKVPFIF